MERTLLLNAGYQPIKIISWRKAITLLYLEKVEVVEEYEREVRSVTHSYKLPAVIRLLKYDRWKRGRVKLTRESLFQRDQYTCQYCHQSLPSAKLTFDHVIPKSQGGRTTWENIVTACLPCNLRKGNRYIEQIGIKLQKIPKEPDWFTFLAISLRSANDHPSWHVYLPQVS